MAITNQQQFEVDKYFWVEGLVARNSDHKLIILTINKNSKIPGHKTKIFRYEARWATNAECGRVIWAEWSK